MNNKYKLIILFILSYLCTVGFLAKDPDMIAGAFLLSFPIAFFYIVPSLIAQRKRKFNTVFWVNLLLGVTIFGWFIALIVAIIPEKEPQKELL